MTVHKSLLSYMVRLEKIVVNVGVGKLRVQSQFDEKILPEIMQELAHITGQKPAPRAARKSIAGFKLREGDVVGVQVTLRGKRMKDFFERLIHLTLPRVKDFRGIALKNVDEHGNLNIGFREQYVFPEIQADKSKVHFGMQVTIVPRTKERQHAIDFYRSVGVPLERS